MNGLHRMPAILLVMLVIPAFVFASVDISMEEANTVAWNYATYMHEVGEWTIQPEAVENAEALLHNGNIVGYYMEFAPTGYAVITASSLLPPVKASWHEGILSFDGPDSPGEILIELLAQKMEQIEELGENRAQWQANGVMESEVDRASNLWQAYTRDNYSDFRSSLPVSELDEYTPGVNLLQGIIWHQGYPYNSYVPVNGYERCPVGCVATAMGMVCLYWQWPPMGEGSHTYTWMEDGVTAHELSADFSDPYDWDHIYGYYSNSPTQVEIDAIAELNYELGVAVEMDYDNEGSGAFMQDVAGAMSAHFRFVESADLAERRDYYGADAWFAVLCAELDEERPMVYGIDQHAIACAGYRVVGGYNQVYMNYGWGGYANQWYTFDSWPLPNPNVECATINLMPEADPSDLAAPTALAGNVDPETGNVTLTWQAPEEGGFEYYKIYRDGTWISIAVTETVVNLLTEYGSYSYTVTAQYPDGESFPSPPAVVVWEETATPETKDSRIPDHFEVSSVYPNPFNSSTSITVALPEAGDVTLHLYNVLGERVAVIGAGHYSTGEYSFRFDASDLATGIYFIDARLNNAHQQIQKIVYSK